MKHRLGRRRTSLSALATCAALAFAAGCGEDGGGGEEPQAEGAAPETVAVEVTGQGADVQLTAPESVPAGLVTIELTNSSEETQDAQLIRVEGDHSAEEVVEALGASFEGEGVPPWFFAGGGVGETPGGETSSVTQPLEPGLHYVLTSASEEALREGNGIAPIEVTGDAADAELPEADATITAEDYSFESSTPLPAGDATIEIDNVGEQPHHVVAAPLRPGATLQDAREFALQEGQSEGPPPVDIEKADSSAVLEGGDAQVAQLELQPGKNVLVCFVTDRDGGPPHVVEGMIAEATVE